MNNSQGHSTSGHSDASISALRRICAVVLRAHQVVAAMVVVSLSALVLMAFAIPMATVQPSAVPSPASTTTVATTMTASAPTVKTRHEAEVTAHVAKAVVTSTRSRTHARRLSRHARKLSRHANTLTRHANSTAPTTPKPALTTTVPAKASTANLTTLNPAANIAPSPNFLQSGNCTSSAGSWSCDNPCVTSSMTWPAYTNNAGCTNYVLGAINVGRSAEGLAPMVLPTNWYSLSQAQQLFVVANLERTARGLPAYLGLNSALSANAQRAAKTNVDPSVASGFVIGNDAQGSPGMGGAWSAGFSVLAADYIWMYDDGWGGSVATTSNIACTSARAAGCWGHRDELLGSDPGYNPGVGLNCSNCEMGTGFAVANGSGSYVDLVEIPKGTPPAMTFTWAQELSQGY